MPLRTQPSQTRPGGSGATLPDIAFEEKDQHLYSLCALLKFMAISGFRALVEPAWLDSTTFCVNIHANMWGTCMCTYIYIYA